MLADVPVVIVGAVEVVLPTVEAFSPVPRNSSAVVLFPPARAASAPDTDEGAAAAGVEEVSLCGRVQVVERVVWST